MSLDLYHNFIDRCKRVIALFTWLMYKKTKINMKENDRLTNKRINTVIKCKV